ncbi:MAG TPA: restriction endonuclease subunit M, partial [Flavobacterium sp.]|nr:restriction endonuclease subunit M [Flavobacterium sp.]
DGKQLFPKIKGYQLKQLPIKIATKNDQQPFIEKADLMLSLNKDLQEVSLKFSKYFSGQYKLEKLSGKLEKWYDVTFEEFIKEINKAIKAQKGTPLTKKDEFEWIDLFEENKAKANKLQNEINTTDKEIDAMVYELYGLTKEEIEIVENS